jgi:hypothetical protein
MSYPKATLVTQVLTAAGATVNTEPFSTDAFTDLIIHQRMATMTGTSPTIETKLQCSGDGTNWIDVGTLGVQSAAGGKYMQFIGPVPRLCRLSLAIGGSSPVITGTVYVEASKRCP